MCLCLVVCEIFSQNSAIVSKFGTITNMYLGHAETLEMFPLKICNSLGPGT